MNKSNIVILVLVCSLACSSSAFADSIDFSKCANNSDRHCYTYSPQLNSGPTLNPNWSINTFLPDGTCNIVGKQDNSGNCNIAPMIFSDNNFTLVKQNPVVMAVRDIHTVTNNENQNYCPFGYYTILHQDGYLYKIYNKTANFDLTVFAYPSMCYAETGKNPINGQGSVTPTPSSITIHTDKSIYNLGDRMTIYGTTTNSTPDLTLMIVSPNNSIVTVSQVTPVGGVFTTSVSTGGSIWGQSGKYTIIATQGSQNGKTTFTLATTAPEFGAVIPIIMLGSFVLIFAFKNYKKLIYK